MTSMLRGREEAHDVGEDELAPYEGEVEGTRPAVVLHLGAGCDGA